MLQSVFSRLKLLPQSQAKDVTRYPPDGNHDDREEDGFLMIGETASDRTTVTHQQYVHQHRMHSPPDYAQVGYSFIGLRNILTEIAPGYFQNHCFEREGFITFTVI